MNCGNVRYRQLRKSTPCLQTLLDPDHWRNVRLQREPKNPTDVYTVAVMENSIVVKHISRKISEACLLYFCAKTKALFTWTTQLMDYILADFNLVVCFQNHQSTKFNSRQYFWLCGMCKHYAYQMIVQLMEIIPTCLELCVNYYW